MLNIKFEKFKKTHKKKINQVLYYELKSNNSREVENLINNFLQDKNSFIFESVEKGVIKGRYTIFGRNPDKIWEFNNNRCQILTGNKKKILIGNPKENIEKIIEEFKFNTPKNLPPICSLISGYFSYDIIRYIERIPNKNKDDLNIPDARILRPRNLVIHDNLKSKLYFIKQQDYHAVPEVIAKNKKPSEYFAEQWQTLVGECELVFTRTPEGRKILLESKVKALANQLDDNKIEKVSKWR